MELKNIAKSLLIAGMFSMVAIQFTGCGAAHTAIKKRNLDVQTKMSETIFLEPTEPEKKVIFVDVRNTSDKDIAVKEILTNALISRGYSITTSPQKAYFMLQVNVLQVGKTDLRGAQSALEGGFGGAVMGATAGYAMHNSNSNAAAGGLIGAAVGVVADALVDDTYYSMITDVQIRERPLAGEMVTQTQKAKLKQGSSTNVDQDIQGGKMEWKTYRTRVVSTANKVNLDFAEAQPVLQDALGKSLSGLF
ncbi:complement resistance protein TraT [Sulfuricurvum sp.]|uniref:complement resistance protein TraT n=1 Tax=Sulfuricurvum sp. TaxID=2025608 RepID=UPI00261B4CA5|nr:complement resistance protein TraT [Sulfuricurvum sp.]MDD2267133.1 complement resistance protein TraT [Sulfuricurvum sp.]MDD2784840.1 complement resistance protein TraT [Sulfuricurvum sp.]